MNTLVSADTRLSSDRVVIVEEMRDPHGTYFVLRVFGAQTYVLQRPTGKAETFSSANNARGFALHHGWQVVS